MNVMMTNAQFFFALSVPLVGILVNAILILMMNQRVGRLEDRLSGIDDRMHTGFDLLIGKINELDVRLSRLEERLSR